MAKGRAGIWVTTSTAGERVRAYVPASLPFKPAIDLAKIQPLLEKATLALGKLDSMVALIPDTSHLIYSYVRKEALLSSQIEGTQSSFDDLLLYENDATPGVPIEDVEEVSHYIAAMNHGLAKIRDDYPIALRLIKEMHKVLLRGGRGSKKQPGEFRHSQNWIGGTRPGNATFVPPPHEMLPELLGNLEHYINDTYGKQPALLKAAIAHVQFETLHPFLDGNGRIGRMLITLILCQEGLLTQPVLYLSLYLKKHRTYYYELLNEVRHQGAWEKWLTFFLEGLIETAQEATVTAQAIAALFAADKAKIATLKRAAPNALRVFELLQTRILCQIPQAAIALELTQPTVTAALTNLAKLGIVKEVSGRKKDRLFCYEGYRALLE